MPVDIDWFQKRIATLGLSQRRISSAILTNPNTLSLILNGKRKVMHNEIPELAKMLETTPEEILRRLGVEPFDTQRSRAVRVIGIVDETGHVSEGSRRTVDAPTRGSTTTRAIVFETAGPETFRNGWVFYFDEPAKVRSVDADTLDALCIVEIGDKKGSYLGVVRRSVSRGRFDVVNPFTGAPVVKEVTIRSAAQVTWIKTGA